MNAPAPTYLNLDQWPRRAAFEFFRRFDVPCFNVCTRIEISRLKQEVSQRQTGTLALAYHHIAIRLCNQLEPFRYRLEGEQVRVHAVVNGSATVLRPDESFAFATLPHALDFAAFAAVGAQTMAAAQMPDSAFAPTSSDSAVVHLSTLPWVHFTSYSNARLWGVHDSIPKIAFGRIAQEGGRLWMPLSVEVHHALMDGLHVGRFIEAFEGAAADPGAWLS